MQLLWHWAAAPATSTASAPPTRGAMLPKPAHWTESWCNLGGNEASVSASPKFKAAAGERAALVAVLVEQPDVVAAAPLERDVGVGVDGERLRVRVELGVPMM